MRRILLFLVVIPIGLAVLAAVAINMFLDEEKMIALTAEAVKEETGAILTVDGGVALNLFPSVGIKLQEVSLESEGQLASARSLVVGVQVGPLLSGKVEIEEISADGLRLTIQSAESEPEFDTTKLSDAELDAFYAERRKNKEAASQEAAAQSGNEGPVALNIQLLSLTDAQIELLGTDGSSTKIELERLQATGFNLNGEAVPLDMLLRLPGAEDEPTIELKLQGSARVDLAAQKILLDALKVAVSGVTPDTIELELKGLYDISKQVADLELAIDLGATQGKGKLRFASFESPQIDTTLHLNLLDPALLVLAGPDAAAAAPTAAPTADTGAATGDEPLPLGALRGIDTRANLTIDQARFEGHVVHNAKIQLRAVDGLIKINTMTGTLHGGELDMTASLNAQHSSAKLNTKGGLKRLEISEALIAMESEPSVSGKANLTWKINGSGATQNELIKALSGPISLTTKKVVLKDMSIEKQLCQAVALVNGQSLSKKLPHQSQFESLFIKLKLNDGKLMMKPLNAKLASMSLTGKGVVDLLKQDFSAEFEANISSELADLDPACKVDERLTSIEWPLNCKGKLSDDPAGWCSVDTGDIIADMATYEAKRQIKKESGKLLNKLFGK